MAYWLLYGKFTRSKLAAGMRKAIDMKGFQLIPVLLLGVGLWSCGDDGAERISEQYFPLQVGFYQVYDVEEIRYSAFDDPQAGTYQLRNEIVEAFTNASGGVSYRMVRSVRPRGDAPWEIKDTWTVRYDAPYYLVTEGNTTYARLINPARLDAQWNGNRFNTLPEEFYTLAARGNDIVPESGFSYGNSVLVVQEDLNELTKTDQRKEIYTAGKGLVYKESRVLTYLCSGGTCTGKIVGGYYEKLLLSESGQE
jgi:hypothetical protein